jgi:hypothetical protein
MLYLQPQIQLAGRVVSVSLYDNGNEPSYFYNVRVKLCNTPAPTLTSDFNDNYGGGGPVAVFSSPALHVGTGVPETWFTFPCSEDFWYYNTDNLLAEVLWRDDDGVTVPMIDNAPGAYRLMWAGSDSASQGTPENVAGMHMRLGILASEFSGRVVSPNGGELWKSDSQSILWSIQPRSFFYGRLHLSTDGGATFPLVLASSVPPSETTRTVLMPEVNSSTCRVRLQCVDSLGHVAFEDISDSSFTIDSQDPAAPALIYPPDDGAVNMQSVVFRWRRASDNLSGIDYYTMGVSI